MGGAVVDEGPTGIKAPDGGWGWAVLFGCFIITGFSYAFPKAVSVFFKELMHEFGIGYSDTAWISSILLAMLYGTGPLCSMCVNRFGCRPVMLVGGLFASLGMVAASFCRSIIQIYLTTGVITGLGLALNFQPSLIMLNRYFNKRRPMANGLAAAGSPVFLCALSPLGQLLQDHYGWRGGFLILGGLLLNCCVCAALMRPLVAPQASGGAEPHGPQRPSPRLLDLSVFRDRGFLIYAVAASIMVLGLFVPPVFVVSYAKDMGVPDTKAAFLLTILGFIDIFARPTAGFITGLKKVRPYSVYLFSFAMFFNGFTDLTGSTASDYGGLVVFCIFFGISYGMVGALQFEVLMAIVGTQKFSSAIGLVLLLEAVAVLIGPPSGGKLLDATKVYKYVFILAGAEVLTSSLVLLLGNFFCIGKRKRPEVTKPEEVASEEEKLHKPPVDVRVDSREVEHFLKAEPEKNGEVVHTPETSV
ncbi:solute carrier family 16 (monocarboxylic acid transporters), member 3, isoform CRA_a [Rattus norvegicus]|uniref:Monocarboxylate transporter 4 n=2 Tax=Rattus norvegicus TaxID=10116 RepID=MOT4_RAT|nr:monocarboxylate transporter 4 [Rattus norvegicus]XP_006247993.1 monocarboxylate transporter 4 isoform X1 [Rattus norvegicus]XP_006247994.1 monocarboxylate transporter 4 isoform X1 [Rattus norvegicus]XP_006247995.1 monocarboxylate transporter 4 isoform X1 [Rattus norvegicus]XP_006247996.1 monocarboxylate transporter 4 isoform X1 [Rattus norvegicus]XP_038942854.1 monocarboxylate transporter 4 isoform X1 [Rattus norvegicus]O35910.1 RecName: Full=Monocarboxylate transporter 4; Short=MCT 4; Alt|eukprot:NP_110461.1 monocarboxylate transporter 4 [Rattus norvegicus]